MKRNLLMKKTIMGFTLAEVLITLTVIGVIAALTIPSLIQNIQDAQLKTVWKKAFSDLNQATNKLMLDNGGTLNGVFQSDSDIVNKYSPYFSSVKSCPAGSSDCWHLTNEWYNLNGLKRSSGNHPRMILGNGNLLFLVFDSQDCTDTVDAGANVPICGFMYEDVNGFKGPNTVGKDIYLVWITEHGLNPAGAKDNYTSTCNAGSSGWGCAAQYLMQ